jgi:rare lipoprotein A (peptidoglycan hydrolase)
MSTNSDGGFEPQCRRSMAACGVGKGGYGALDFGSLSADNNEMKKISVVCVFFLGLGGFLGAQSDEASSLGAGEAAGSSSAVNNFRQEGVASWYGAEFAGRPTASGEIFDPAQLTAAHAELPFGTYLVVTNTENGKKIAVRVNDRGPFVRSRVLDVSRAAAERLDMLAAGTAKVVIEATTREAAQSLVRELGVSAAVTAVAPSANTPSSTAPAPVSSSSAAPRPSGAPALPSAVPAPASSGNAAPRAPAASGAPASPSAVPAPASSGNAATPPSGSPASPAATPPSAAPRASASSGSTAPPPIVPATASGAATAPVAPTVPSTVAPPAPEDSLAGTPVMAPTAPRTPTAAPALVPSPSVSRVTGQVENIPEIRRTADPGYVVVDEQVTLASPPVYVPPLAATPPRNNAPQTAASTAPRTATPPSAAPPRTNPAASVPVTNPPSDPGKAAFTGSQMVRGKNYRVQVGSFADLKNASDIFLRLFDAGLNPSYEHYEDKYYRVVITNVKAEDADNLSRKLAEIGITEALTREDADSR